MQPLISVVLPTYQRPALLARALASVAPALVPGQPHEVIVIDDDPAGSGFAPAMAYGARYVAKAGIDRGLSASRNIGLDLARGQWLVFLDDDDHFSPGGLARLLAATGATAASGAPVGIVFGDFSTQVGELLTGKALAPVTTEHLLVCNQIPVGAYIIQRSAIQRRFDTRLRSHEDWEFLLAHAQAAGLRHVPGIVAVIDKSDNQAGSMQARRRQHFWLDFLSIYARFPAPHLAEQRSRMLQSLGIQVPADMLAFTDQI